VLSKDTRTPVWVGVVKGKTVRIYDWDAYEQAKLDYPDDPNVASREHSTNNSKPPFAKQKPAARYNWIVPLEKPLAGRVEKGRTA